MRVPRPGGSHVGLRPLAAVRRPSRDGFGWLDLELLRSGVISKLTPASAKLLLFLAMVSDERGRSWWGTGKLGEETGLGVEGVERARDELVLARVVGFAPWRAGGRDGLWLLLPRGLAPAVNIEKLVAEVARERRARG